MLRLRLFPEREVIRRPLVALSVQRPCTFKGVIKITAGKYAVMEIPVIFLDIEIDAAVAFVGIAGRKNLLYCLNLLDNMSGSPRLDGRRRHVEPAHGLMVAQRIFLNNLHRLKLFQTCLLGNLVLPLIGVMFEMPDIGNIADIPYLISEMPQQFAQDIESDTRACMPEMRVTVYSRAADIHSDMPRVDRDKYFFLPRQRVCEPEISHRFNFNISYEDKK